MSIRSTLLATLAVGFIGLGTAAADAPKTTNHNGGSGFQCSNGVGVGCVGSIATLPITVNIKDVSALSGNQLTVLSDDLDHVSILDGDILDYNTILNDVEGNVLSDFLNKFNINVDYNDIDVCTIVGILQLCK
jgi:hypothetical protein